jgi:hypothetical protein
MKIGILGAGFIGRAMATLAKEHGHEVMISNSRDPRTLTSTAAAIGCALGTAEQAAKFGDVVVVAVPFGNIDALPAAALDAKIVIDTCNYYPDRDGPIDALDARATTTSQMLAAALPVTTSMRSASSASCSTSSVSIRSMPARLPTVGASNARSRSTAFRSIAQASSKVWRRRGGTWSCRMDRGGANSPLKRRPKHCPAHRLLFRAHSNSSGDD